LALTPGTRLGVYEVTAQIGEGGMGQVYRATDTTLGRQVAIKILPDAFAADPERLARFEREAKTLASLNHPNIAAIYGFEKSSGIHALVMELVEGEDLSQRIARGPIPLDEALPIARQIAEALEAAHEQGIIHRDLKPANIKVRLEGTVKVLDFGLAKAMEPAPGPNTRAMQSPTLSLHATQAGIILGTAAYMSPEQARGKPVDRRTDIWAFGCVVYEMLTGRRAFDGDTVTDVIAAIVTRDPSWTPLPAETPVALRTLLRRCLLKGPEQRVPHVGLARMELAELIANPKAFESGATAPSPGTRNGLNLIGVVVTAIAALISGAGVWVLTRPSPVPRQVVRLHATPPATTALVIDAFAPDVALSPDGRHLAYIAGTGQAQLYLRRLDQSEAAPVGGIVGVRGPFFSPDSEWVAFFQGPDLKKVDVRGGPPVTICQNCVAGNRGGTWGPDDTIIFAADGGTSGLQRIPAGGGDVVALAKPDLQNGERGYAWPEFLPDGQGVLFTILPNGPIEGALVAVRDLRTGAQHVLVRGGSHAHFVRPGYLVYAAAGTLRAMTFDAEQFSVTGNAAPVLNRVLTKSEGAADFSVSHEGSVAYISGEVQGASTLAWRNRDGHEEPIGAPPRSYLLTRLSPDGARVALDVRDQENDIWIWDFARRVLTRLTTDRGLDMTPVWTPDGKRIVFASSREGGAINLFSQAADGTGTIDRLTTTARSQFPLSFTPDGTSLVIREAGAKGNDLSLLAMQGDHTVTPLMHSPFSKTNAEISPDGHWMAFQSNESGQDEVHVRPFPNVDEGHWQISNGGGTRPLWAHSGRELFYIDSKGRVMAVPIQTKPRFANGNASVALVDGIALTAPFRDYDVSLDGRRFLIIRHAVQKDTSSNPVQLNIVLNWDEELGRLVPRKH